MDAATVGMPGDGEVSCRRCGREGEGAAARDAESEGVQGIRWVGIRVGDDVDG
jgi:hypothetical protein